MKKIIIIILCLFLLIITGCSKEELSFEGTVVAVEPSRYLLGIIIENSDKQRVRIDKAYSNTETNDIKTVIVGDNVELVYVIDSFEDMNCAKKFKIIMLEE